MDFNIRQAIPDDFESILKLNKALFDNEEIFTKEYSLDWTYSDEGKNYLKKTIESGLALVAEVNEKVVGYIAISIYSISFRKENPISELDNMFVEDKFRSKGIGKKLVEQAKGLAKDKGARRFKVEATAKNEKAIKFYKDCGFEDFDVILEMNL